MNKEIYVYKGREYQAADVKEVIQLHREGKNSLPTVEERKEIIQRELKNLYTRIMDSIEPVKYYKLNTLSSKDPISTYEYNGNTMANGSVKYIVKEYNGDLKFNGDFPKGRTAIFNFEKNNEMTEQDFIERMEEVYEKIMKDHDDYKEKFLQIRRKRFIEDAEKMKEIYKLIENFRIQ